MGATYLDDLAHELLGAASSALVFSRTGNPVPERVGVVHHEPAWDLCQDGQLTVHFRPERMVETLGLKRTGLGIAGSGGCDVLPRAHMCVTLLRCVPTMEEGGAPHPISEYDDSAAGLLRDLWSLLTHLYHEHFAGTLFSGHACSQVVIGDAVALPPSGGMAGFRVCVDVDLNDPGPPEAS